MQAQTLNAATKLAVSTVACTLRRVQGYLEHTGDAWLQIHDSAAEPAANAVPVKSYQLLQDAAFSWAFDPASLALRNGCYIAISSDEEKYTTIAYSEGVTYCDILADYEPYVFLPADYSVAGNLSDAVGSLTIFADADGDSHVKRVYIIDYINHTGAAAWLMLFTNTTMVTAGAKPLIVLGPKDGVADAGQIRFDFGDGGLSPSSREGLTGTAGTEHFGCFAYESSDPEVFADPGTESSHIRAYYK